MYKLVIIQNMYKKSERDFKDNNEIKNQGVSQFQNALAFAYQ